MRLDQQEAERLVNACSGLILRLSYAYLCSTQDGEGIGTFLKEGMLYKVSLYGGAMGQFTEAEMAAQLHQVLDTFY